MTMQGYRERVEKLALSRKGEPVFNGSIDHAAIVVESMFRHARNQVSILTGKLNSRVYGPDEVVKEAKLFLGDPTHKLRILFETSEAEDLAENPFILAFGKYKNVEIRSTAPQDRNLKSHLLVMDDDSYRYEPDKNEFVALAAFGDKAGAGSMQTYFDQLWNRASSLAIAA